MTTRRLSNRKTREPLPRVPEVPREVALAAISAYKKQEDVDNFITFVAGALKKNSTWLDDSLAKLPGFKCVIMTGSGPNSFEVNEQIYPNCDEYIRVGVEMTECEDHDKIAIAAVMKITNSELEDLVKYVTSSLDNNAALKEALYRGRRLGISYAVLKPVSDKEYRFVQKIAIGTYIRQQFNLEPVIKKRRYAPFLGVVPAGLLRPIRHGVVQPSQQKPQNT